MLRFALFILTFFICDWTLFAQTKVYRLLGKTENADFNYRSLSLIDTTTTNETLRNIFSPVNGKNTVYVFMATYRGLSFNNTEKEFNDILIVKTNRNQKILDAYHYTLEWAEPPLSYDLYKASAKSLTLANQLSIENLLFRRVNSYEGTASELKEKGVFIF